MGQVRPTTPESKPELPPLPIREMALGLVVPGLGHWIAGRRYHALVFGVSVTGLMALGLWWSNMTALDPNGHPIYFYMQMVGGLVGWIAHFGGFTREARIGDTPGDFVGVIDQMIGVCYCAVAGILNLIALLELARHGNSTLNAGDGSADKPAAARSEGAKA